MQNFNDYKTQFGTSATDSGLSNIQIGTAARSWFDIELPAPPQMSIQDWEKLKMEAGHNPEAIVAFQESQYQMQIDYYNRCAESLEKIAESAQSQVIQALEELHIALDNNTILKEQVENLGSISEDMKTQADSAFKQMKILKQQYELISKEAAAAKKDAAFSKILSIIAVIISIAMPLITEIAMPIILAKQQL